MVLGVAGHSLPAAAGDDVLKFGSSDASLAYPLSGFYFGNCFETDGALVVGDLAWLWDSGFSDFFYTDPFFGIARRDAIGGLDLLWSAAVDVNLVTSVEARPHVTIETPGEYCVLLWNVDRWLDFELAVGSDRNAGVTLTVDGFSVSAEPTAMCWGDITTVKDEATTCSRSGVEGFYNLSVELSLLDADGDGSPSGLDCDDAHATVAPGRAEICNGVDDNCNGQTDEGVTGGWFLDLDGDGFGGGQVAACTLDQAVDDDSDCQDDDPDIFPGADEHCDGVDENCDGAVDEDAVDAELWFEDHDGDGIGNPELSLAACDWPGFGFTLKSDDCDDADIFRATDCTAPDCGGASSCGGSGGVHVTLCEVSTAAILFPWFLRLRRRARRSR